LSDEARGWLPHLSRGLVKSAANHVLPEYRDRYREEWLAEVHAYRDRPLTAFLRAAGIRRSVRVLNRQLGHLADASFLDRVVAAAAWVVVAPLFGLIALLIRATSPGPVFFRVPCVRSDGRRYDALRFRTMRKGAGELHSHLTKGRDLGGPIFKLYADPRITRVGRFLRRTGLDELPYLFNVLRGERPLLPPGMTWRQALRLLSRGPT
jgi:hypothetical protein